MDENFEIESKKNKSSLQELISGKSISFESIMVALYECDKEKPLDFDGRVKFMDIVSRSKLSREQVILLKTTITPIAHSFFMSEDNSLKISHQFYEWSKLFTSLGFYEQHIFDGVNFTEPMVV